MRIRAAGFLAILATAPGLWSVTPALASRPVPRTIAGCVIAGAFISSDGYTIRPRYADGRETDLRPLEGRAVTISGALLPGDAFIVNTAPVDDGPCKTKQTHDPPPAKTQDVTGVLTGNWLVRRPSRSHKDLPTFFPEDSDSFEAGIGLLQFVCLKSAYHMLLVSPSAPLHDIEKAMVAFAPGQPAAVTFRNLYKSKAPLSRSIDWDADIHHTEIDAPLLAQMATADTLDLKLAHKRYAIALTGFASRFESFRQFCEKGTVRDPRHFDTRR
jgi:hypothetical protein